MYYDTKKTFKMNNSGCSFPILRLNGENEDVGNYDEDTWIFGSIFMSSYYFIF